jgi:hypothetical protein
MTYDDWETQQPYAVRRAGALSFLARVSQDELLAAVGAVIKMRAYRRAAPVDFTPEPITIDKQDADDAWNRVGKWARVSSDDGKPVLNLPTARPQLSHDAMVAYLAEYNHLPPEEVEAALFARAREGTPCVSRIYPTDPIVQVSDNTTIDSSKES